MNEQGEHDELSEKFFQEQPVRRKVFAGAGMFGGVDLLVANTAGQDLEAWRKLDFSLLRPQLIVQGYGRQREAALNFLSAKGYSLLLDDQQNLFMARLNHAADSALQLPATLNFTGLTGRPGYEEIQKEMESRLHKWIQKPADKIELIVVVGGYLAHEVKSFLANYPKAEIHVFEPSRRYFSELARIYAGNPRVHCHNLAVAEREGRLRFYEGSLPGVGSLLPFKTQPDQQTWIPDNCRPEEEFEVQAVTLDSFEPLRDKSIDLLWCDVQGAELKVLRGAVQTLRRCQALFLEVATTKMTYEGQCELGELQRMALANGFYMAGIGLCPSGNGTGNSLWLGMANRPCSVSVDNQLVAAGRQNLRLYYVPNGDEYHIAVLLDQLFSEVKPFGCRDVADYIERRVLAYKTENASRQLWDEVSAMQPDLVYVESGYNIEPAVLQRIRTELGIPVTMWFGDACVDRHFIERILSYAACVDWQVVVDGQVAVEARRRGLSHVEFIPFFGYDHFFKPLSTAKTVDILFSGKSYSDCYDTYPFARQRADFIRSANQEFGARLLVVGEGWEKSGLANYRPQRVPEWEINDLNNAAKIVLAFDACQVEDFTSCRTYHALLGKSFVVTRKFPGIEKFFVHGEHLVWFETEAEGLALLRHYLEHSGERERVAQAGFEHVHRNGWKFSNVVRYLAARGLKNETRCFEQIHAPYSQPLFQATKQDASPALLVSAIVSTFNSERYMRGCLEDLTSQTLFVSGQLEIIVIDSRSEQNERGIVEEFQKKFPNIIYQRTEERETVYAAWNRGAKMARGRFLTNANTDDRHRPDALAVMAAYLEEHPEIAVVYADQLITHFPNETFAETQSEFRWNWPEYSYTELERRCILGSQPVWRRSLHDKYGLFQPDLRSAGDYEFWLRVGKEEKMHRLPDILGLYLHSANGIELGAGHSVRETNEVRGRYGILARQVQEVCSVPVPISREALNKLPFRKVVLQPPSHEGFNPAKPDFSNTPVSPLRPARSYHPTDPAARPVVTIITPFFNTGDIFDETAQTVLGQTFQQWEWLIINDASTAPEAERVLSRYRQVDPRIKVIDQPANKGPGAARNRGVKMAAGDYIVQLDSDDLLEPTAVEKWLWHLESHPEHAFVKGYSVGFGAKNYLWNNGFHNREAFLKENLVDLTSMIRKTTFAKVGGYAEEMRQGFEDWEFWLRCASHGLWGGTVPEHLNWYRRRENHNDRWSNWDNAVQQRKACAELQKKYQRLEKSFPSPQPPPIQPGAEVNLDAPARNQLKKSQPRLLLILPWMTLGGADKFNLDLLGQLTGRGWEVTCATTLQGDHSWMPEFGRFTPDIFAMPHFLEAADYPRFLSYLIQSRQIDTVLISNSLIGYQLLPFLRSRFPELTILDYCHMEDPEWLDGGYPRLSLNNSSCLDLSVVSSQHLKRWMVAKSGLPGQIEVCYTNIDAKEWEPDLVVRQRVRSQLEIPHNQPVILYAGRVVEQKQPRVFAETMRLLQAKNRDFTALVAGDGPDLPWLKEFVAQHKLGNNVRFLGGVSNQRIRELMRAADIFFLPSQWEGIALSIFEAMACGLAVVGADVGGQRELVSPGCGHLLPRGEAASEAGAYAAVLADLTADAKKTHALGQTARERVTKEFALEQMGERMVALIQQAQKRHKAETRPPIPLETGLAVVAEIVEMSSIQRRVNTALELVKKGEVLPALEIFQHVHGLAQRSGNKSLEGDMDNIVAHLRKFIESQSATPLVAVVIPCYKQASFLPEAVASVVAQTFSDWEILIVNDGSPDNTSEVAGQLIAKYPGKKIRLVEKANGGLPSARNAGMRVARGKYLLPLDADDKIKPEFLAKLVPILNGRPKVGFAYTHIQHFGEIDTEYPLPDFDRATLISKDNIACVCALVRRSAWEKAGGYNEAMREGYEDWDFWIGCVEHGWEGYCLHEPLFLYRKNGQSMLSNANQKRERLIAQIVQNHPKLYDEATQQSAKELLARHTVAKVAEVAQPAAVSPSVQPDQSRLRITYLITSILGVTGGNQTLLRQAEEMRRRGHDVTIVTYTARPDWFQFQTRVIQAPTNKPLSASVPLSDVVVATYFTNAHELPAIKAPVKIYYAQGDQFVFDDATMADTPQNRQWRELSRASYLLPGIRFVPNSRNLAAAVQKLCGRRPDAILPVCTDQTVFRPLQRSVPGSKFRLLIVGPDARGTETEPLLFKGIQDIHDALQILARKYPHFTAVRMSGSGPDIFGRFPCEFYIAPNDEMKTMLFGTAHIHIYASHYDSCPRPPQEAMAAGCAVVCTASAGAMEYCRDGENALLVPIKSPEAIAAAVERLIHDHALREKLVQGGLATAREFPREREWNEWESILFRFVNEAAKPAQAAAVAAQPAKPAAQVKLPACAMVGHLGEARDLLDKKKLQAAWKSACAAMQVRSFHPEACLFLGKVAQAAGDSATARLCGQQAVRLAPDWKPAKQFLKALPRSNGKPSQFVLPLAISEKADATPRLSVCLIVKNEEQFLAQCLQSVRDLAHQIVVVDTGSTDRTIEIAKEFNAEVHSFAWNDDFSAARNEALKYATGDWVLSLDADEELLPEHRQTILEEMQSSGVMGYRLPIIDHGREQEGCSYVPRLFRNAPGLFFVGRVHEQIFSSLEVRAKEWGLENRLGRAVLLHHGYRQEVVASRNKSERNLRLLQLAMEELPGEPNLVMNLGLEKIRAGQLEAGLEQYREALRLMAALPSGQVVPELRETLLTQLTTHLIGAGRFGEIVELWRQPFPQSSGLTASQHFMLGLAQMELKQPAAAAEQMRQCLTKRGQRALSPINKDILKAGPHHCLALSLAVLEQKDEAEKAFRDALAEDAKSRPVRVDFAKFQFQQGRPVEALKLLTELVSENCHDIQARQLGGQIALSQPEFLEFAQAWTVEAIKHSPEDATLLLQRAEALMLSQQPELALPLWIQAHAPNSARHLAAITLCEVLSGECRRHFEPAAEKSVSQEFLKWYRHLIKFKARSIVNQINERRDDFRAILPGAVGVLDSAMKKAETAMAV